MPRSARRLAQQARNSDIKGVWRFFAPDAGERDRPTSRRTGKQGNAMPAIIPHRFVHNETPCEATELSVRQHMELSAASKDKPSLEQLCVMLSMAVRVSGEHKSIDWWLDESSDSFRDACLDAIEESKKKVL